MTAPADGDPLPLEATVMRLPSPVEDFFPKNGKPVWLIFNPTRVDIREAETTGKNVRVSVWDIGRTTIAEVKRFRGEKFRVFTIALPALREIAQRHLFQVAAVYDPYKLPESTWPGASGHGGLEGLDRPSGPGKKLHTAFLQDIVDACKEVPVDEPPPLLCRLLYPLAQLPIQKCD
jgi:hypothetical protein